MPRGYTSITLQGGNRDGGFIDDVPLRNLPLAISFKSECYFAKSSNGDMSLMKGPLNSLWHSYTIDIYSKVVNKKDESGTIFEFIETRDVERCSAITKKKTQCLKPAVHNKTSYCESHSQ